MLAKNTYRDLGYCLGLVPGLLAIAGNLAGGNWALATIVLLLALWAFDWFCWEDLEPPAERSPALPDLILALHVVVITVAVGTLLHGIHSHILTRKYIWFAAVSVGICAGTSGIAAGHELFHRTHKAWRWAGLWNLLLVNYGHFYVSHVRIHHKFVGTPRDPSTARRGESIYHFLPRSIVHNFLLSFQVEAKRARHGRKVGYGWSNLVVRLVAAQVAMAAAVGLLLGPVALLAYLLQSAVAIQSLEVVNYLEHYGLERRPGERVGAMHSWHVDTVCDRFLLLELNRHADHHLRASRPYHELVSHPDSPALPAGYCGLVPLMLVPPLWFRVMHPLIDRLEDRRPGQGKNSPARAA